MRIWLAAGLALAMVAGPVVAQTGGAPAPALVAFEIVGDGIPKPLTDKPGDPKEGEKVVTTGRLGNCLACHQSTALKKLQFHGEIGPPLDGAGSRWNEAQLRLIIVNSKKIFSEETVMPAFYRLDGFKRVRGDWAGKTVLSAQQVEDVVAYLKTLKD
jgi:sulfur-oxidizing protein SoxX